MASRIGFAAPRSHVSHGTGGTTNVRHGATAIGRYEQKQFSSLLGNCRKGGIGTRSNGLCEGLGSAQRGLLILKLLGIGDENWAVGGVKH